MNNLSFEKIKENICDNFLNNPKNTPIDYTILKEICDDFGENCKSITYFNYFIDVVLTYIIKKNYLKSKELAKLFDETETKILNIRKNKNNINNLINEEIKSLGKKLQDNINVELDNIIKNYDTELYILEQIKNDEVVLNNFKLFIRKEYLKNKTIPF